jgi:hypothetical protein
MSYLTLLPDGAYIRREAESTRYYDRRGNLHREEGPAIYWLGGATEWCHNGEPHRIGGPAVERPNGQKEWWQKGKLHRIDGPAVVLANGREEYIINGEGGDVSPDGETVWEFEYGKTYFFQNGKLVRVAFSSDPEFIESRRRLQTTLDTGALPEDLAELVRAALAEVSA